MKRGFLIIFACIILTLLAYIALNLAPILTPIAQILTALVWATGLVAISGYKKEGIK